MISIEQMGRVLDALPDPAFILSRSGRYVYVYGGRDTRYYHDGSGLIGLNIPDLIKPEKANWFLEQINIALDTHKLLVVEYELSNKDVLGLPDEGPEEPIWFEGRVQSLDFQVGGEDVVLWVASNISERHKLEVRLRELSDTDQLTGLYNRRKLEYDLDRCYEAFIRYATPTSLLMVDLDNLKTINDSLGHHVGDDMIRAAADTCRATLRKTDIACRFGGDEFVIALPNTDRDAALQLAHRLHERFRAELSLFRVGHTVVTASLGVTSIIPDDRSYEDTLRRADKALYESKGRGKDRVVVA